jgi:hypothetical protein
MCKRPVRHTFIHEARRCLGASGHQEGDGRPESGPRRPPGSWPPWPLPARLRRFCLASWPAVQRAAAGPRGPATAPHRGRRAERAHRGRARRAGPRSRGGRRAGAGSYPDRTIPGIWPVPIPGCTGIPGRGLTPGRRPERPRPRPARDVHIRLHIPDDAAPPATCVASWAHAAVAAIPGAGGLAPGCLSRVPGRRAGGPEGRTGAGHAGGRVAERHVDGGNHGR